MIVLVALVKFLAIVLLIGCVIAIGLCVWVAVSEWWESRQTRRPGFVDDDTFRAIVEREIRICNRMYERQHRSHP